MSDHGLIFVTPYKSHSTGNHITKHTGQLYAVLFISRKVCNARNINVMLQKVMVSRYTTLIAVHTIEVGMSKTCM